MDKESYSDCIAKASAYQSLSFFWAKRCNDSTYQSRYRMCVQDCEHQSKLYAGLAVEWYAKANKKKYCA